MKSGTFKFGWLFVIALFMIWPFAAMAEECEFHVKPDSIRPDPTSDHFFVVNGLDGFQEPASVWVSIVDGDLHQVPLEKRVGGAAHYYLHLEEAGVVSDAWAMIDCDWSGQFIESWQPTGVKILWFKAEKGPGKVELKWETATEIDNLGFNLYLFTQRDGWVKINREFIPPKVPPGSPFGAEYSFSHFGGIVNNLYLLEDVDIYFRSCLHGPVRARPSLGTLN